MISHVTLGTNDLARARAFYAPVMARIGWRLAYEEADWLGWLPVRAATPLLSITLPENREAAVPGNGVSIALEVTSHDAIREAHAEGLKHGGHDAGAPGPRPAYHADFFGAYLRDPDGNKLCLCCQTA